MAGDEQTISDKLLICFCSNVTERYLPTKQSMNICTFIQHWLGADEQ
jgi:hypothetical protein